MTLRAPSSRHQHPSTHVAMIVEQMWQPVPGGSGTYIAQLCHALRDDAVPLVGLTARHRRHDADRAAALGGIPLRAFSLPRTLLYESWNRFAWPSVESVVDGADVVHATTWAIPSTRHPLAVTVHDVAFLRSPEHFTRRGAAFFRRALERTRACADAVIVPSQMTADDCIDAGIEAQRITVIPHGVQCTDVTTDQVTDFMSRYGLHRPFIMWAGTREPRKNLSTVLKAFAWLCRQPAFDHDLVLVGPAGWGTDEAMGELASAIPSERLHVVGRLPEADLAAAYSAADVFIFPSLWEGFGLPVLEAMAHGTPVVTSEGTCMEEVCGDTGVLIDPFSEKSLAQGICQALDERDDRGRQARDRASGFTWSASAQAHESVYRSMVKN